MKKCIQIGSRGTFETYKKSDTDVVGGVFGQPVQVFYFGESQKCRIIVEGDKDTTSNENIDDDQDDKDTTSNENIDDDQDIVSPGKNSANKDDIFSPGKNSANNPSLIAVSFLQLMVLLHYYLNQ